MSTAQPAFGKKACSSCPSYIDTDEVAQLTNKSINAPVCGRFGKVLGLPSGTAQHNSKILQAQAAVCPSFGEPKVMLTAADIDLEVAFPDLNVASTGGPKKSQDMVKSCNMCEHHIPDYVVQGEFGWWTGLCKAKGKLILGNRQTYEARYCEFKSFGQAPTTRGVTLFPHFEDQFWTKGTFKELLAKQQEKPDPREYVSDRPISAEDTAAGVRAYRQVVDPEGTGNFTFLPVFANEFFSDNERSKIPATGDDEHPENYIDHNGAVYKIAVAWMELDETPMLWGPAGVGKTELLRHMAWLMQLPFERISITGSTELDDLAGKMLFEDGETIFRYGRVPLAWGKPGVICLDEPNVGPPDVWQFIRPLTDNSKQLVLDVNKGEKLPRNEAAFMGMACNPSWDAINVGAQTIGDADGSRLLHIYMELPPADIEREILRARCDLDGWEITDKQLDVIMGIAADLRALCENQSLPISWGIRNQIKVVRASRWFDLAQAYKLAAADQLEPSASEELLNVVKSHADDRAYKYRA